MVRPKLESLGSKTYDVIIVGAGAVGCAAARELAGRGFNILLVDRGDIGAGTSSRSSRMLYSGLGYLAARYPLWQIIFHPFDMWQRLKYSRAVMQCRAELVREMPDHLTKHQFYYPFRKKDQYPPWLVDVGFRLIEALGGWKVPLHYRRMSRQQAGKQSALVEQLVDSVYEMGVFEEYMYAWPERICVDTALDAEQRGAVIRNYTEVVNIEKEKDFWQVELIDRAPESEGRVSLKTKMVINTAGPWVDRVPGGGGEYKKRAIGIKGVNVMVRLPPSFKGQGLEAFSSKGEPFYVFPWRDCHFIGPTETVFTDNPDNVQVEDWEVDYILEEANTLFPSLNLNRDSVLHCWCGVRPTSTTDGQSVFLPVRLSEEPSKRGLLTLTGSTIMLHRHAGRMIAKAVESRLGVKGSAPKGVINKKAQDLKHVPQMLITEHVVRLSDLIRRRLPYGLDLDLGKSQADTLSRLAADSLGWTESRRLEELRVFEEETDRIYKTME